MSARVILLEVETPLTCTEIANGVFLIDTMTAGVPGLVASYLIRGERSALVDAGYPTSANTVLSELRALDDKRWQVDYLIPTHVHLDHAGGVGYLAKEMPVARVLVSEHGAKHVIDPTQLIQSAAGLFGNEVMAMFGDPIPVPNERVEAIREACDLDLGAGKRLKVFWTPGHAWHHMSVFLENERLLITGDAVGLHNPNFDIPIPATPPPGFDAAHYMSTLERFMGMNPAGLLLPHFGPLGENPKAFLETNLDMAKAWVSRAFEAVKRGESLDAIFEFFITDATNRSGKQLEEIPEYVSKTIMLSAMGCLAYAQAATA